MLNKLFAGMALWGLFFSSCKAQNTAEAPPVEFAEHIKDTGIILLDVRTPEEYAEGHLKDALLINYYDSDFMDQVSKLDKTKPVYIYCRSGSRSGNAQEKMLKAGFQKVENLDGGIVAWQKAALPVVK